MDRFKLTHARADGLQQAHLRLSRIRQYRIKILLKIREVQMAMRVDDKHAYATFSATCKRGNTPSGLGKSVPTLSAN